MKRILLAACLVNIALLGVDATAASNSGNPPPAAAVRSPGDSIAVEMQCQGGVCSPYFGQNNGGIFGRTPQPGPGEKLRYGGMRENQSPPSRSWRPVKQEDYESYRSCYMILTKDKDLGNGMVEGSGGSGVMVKHNGVKVILTNHHVIENAISVKVIGVDGKASDATVVGSDSKWDVAALYVPSLGNAMYNTRKETLIERGEPVYLIGYGSDEVLATCPSTVQAFVSPDPGAMTDWVDVVDKCRNGDSGGPVIDDGGKLAGILWGGGKGRGGGSCFVGIGRIAKVLDEVGVSEQAKWYRQAQTSIRNWPLGKQNITLPPQQPQQPIYTPPINGNCDLQCQQLGQRITAIEQHLANLPQTDPNAIGKLQQDIDASNEQSQALAGKLAGVDGMVDEKVSKASGGILSKAKAGVIAWLKSMIPSASLLSLGGIGIVLFLVWKFWLKGKLDAMDGKTDGVISFLGIAERGKWAFDKRDGKVDYTYSHNPQVMAEAEAMRAANRPQPPAAPPTQ